MNFYYLNNLFNRLIRSEKSPEDIGVIAPCYKEKNKAPLYEECFALEFLKNLGKEYQNIEFHDIQMKTGKYDPNSMDLVCRNTKIGVEVVQGINEKFREEESCWNKPVCKGTSTILVHEWQNQPTSLEIIQKRIEDKNLKYQKYIKEYDYVDDIDLFVYILDAGIINSNSLAGIPMPKGFCPTNIDLSENGLRPLLKELKTPYRKVYIIFANYWYCFDRDNDFKPENCILRVEHLENISQKAIDLQNSTEIK